MSAAITSNGNGSNDRTAADTRAPVPTAPPVDVYENDDEFLVTVDVPGARADSVHVELEHDRISIAARAEAAGAGRARRYHRSFVVPDGIEGAGITAELRQGVLRVRLPKSAARKPRVIPVRGPAA